MRVKEEKSTIAILLCNVLTFILLLSMFSPLLYAKEKYLKAQAFVDASSNNFPPMNSLDANGDLIGFGRELADAVMDAVGAEVKHIHSSQWIEVLEWLDNGKADFIHDTGYTKDRDEFLDYSKPIIEMPEMIFVRPDQYDITELHSLNGKKVACVNKHISHIYLQSFPEIDCYIVKTPVEGLLELISGKVDAFVYPEQIVLYLSQKLRLLDEIKSTGEPLRTLTWSMVVKEGNNEVLTLLNKGIDKVKQSGEYERIYNKWWGKKILAGYSEHELYIIIFVAVVITISIVSLIALGLYNYKLRSSRDSLKKEIAQRKQAEYEFKNSEEKYRLAMEASNDGLWDWNVETGEVFYSSAWSTILSEDSVRPEYQTWESKIHPDDKFDVLSSLKKHLDGETPYWQKEHRLKTKHGKWNWVLGRGRIVNRDHQGLPLRMVGTMTDITDRKQAEQDREILQNQLNQAQKMESVGRLAAGMAHEINNPLAGVIQNVSVLENRLTDQTMPANIKAAQSVDITMDTIGEFMEKREIPRIVGSIKESGARMATIVENMLNFARKSDSSYSTHDPIALMDKVLELASTDYDLKKHYDFKSIIIEKEYENNLPMVACESSKIQQVILNILNNGAYAMFESSKNVRPKFILRLNREQVSNMLRIEIEDNGPGMDRETTKLIFEPFFTTKPEGVGTGLGLSVSYFIITENHKGSMDVISELGIGSTFIIRLPLC